jgi:hypothetical protein
MDVTFVRRTTKSGEYPKYLTTRLESALAEAQLSYAANVVSPQKSDSPKVFFCLVRG